MGDAELPPVNYADFEKIALADPDFASRYQKIKGVKIGPKNYMAVQRIIVAFDTEKKQTILDISKRGENAIKAFNGEADTYPEDAKREMTELLAHMNNIIECFGLMEAAVAQVSAMQGAANTGFTDALDRAYLSPDDTFKEIMGIIVDAAPDARKVAEKLTRIEELGKEKKNGV